MYIEPKNGKEIRLRLSEMSDISDYGDSLRASHHILKESCDENHNEHNIKGDILIDWKNNIIKSLDYNNNNNNNIPLKSNNPMINKTENFDNSGNIKSEQTNFMSYENVNGNNGSKDGTSFSSSNGVELLNLNSNSNYYNNGDSDDDMREIPRYLHLMLMIFGVQLYNHNKYYNKNGTKKKNDNNIMKKDNNNKDENDNDDDIEGQNQSISGQIKVDRKNVKSVSKLNVLNGCDYVSYLLAMFYMIFLRSLIIIGCLLSICDYVIIIYTHTYRFIYYFLTI